MFFLQWSGVLCFVMTLFLKQKMLLPSVCNAMCFLLVVYVVSLVIQIS